MYIQIHKGSTKHRDWWNRQRQWHREATQTEHFFLFFFDWGYMCGCQTTKTWLASQAPLQCSLWKLPYCEYVQAENLSGYSWFSSWTGVICGGITPKDNTCSQTPLQNFTKNLSCYIEENIWRSVHYTTEMCSLHHWNVLQWLMCLYILTSHCYLHPWYGPNNGQLAEFQSGWCCL